MPRVTEDLADSEFGLRMRRAWKNSKFSGQNQTQLADHFGYSKQGINFIVNGKRYPHLSSGLQISKEMNVCLDWLYTGRDPMRPGKPDPYIKLAHKLMPLEGTRLKLIDLLIGLVVDRRIDSDDLIDWLVTQYGIDMIEEHQKIKNRQREEILFEDDV